MSNNIKAIIFDRDWVIIDSERVNIFCTTEILKGYNIEISETDKKFLIGRSIDDCKDYFLGRYDFNRDEFVVNRREFSLPYLDEAPLYQDTIETIISLYNTWFTLALCTSAWRATTLKVLERAKILDYFKVIVCKEDVVKRKPDPAPYLKTLEKLWLEANECIVIEDSINGLQASTSAGIKTIVIPNEYTKDQNFSWANMVISTPKDITIELINNL